MTVRELKAKLAKYPDNYKVVIDVSTDYEDYDEVTCITPCEYGIGICGKTVTRGPKKALDVNAILLT